MDGEVETSPKTVGLCTELQQSPGLAVHSCHTMRKKGIGVHCSTLVGLLACMHSFVCTSDLCYKTAESVITRMFVRKRQRYTKIV